MNLNNKDYIISIATIGGMRMLRTSQEKSRIRQISLTEEN
jgi:hypothetical protein